MYSLMIDVSMAGVVDAVEVEVEVWTFGRIARPKRTRLCSYLRSLSTRRPG
jgi:hypothetical protein